MVALNPSTFVGRSPALLAAWERARRAAGTMATVMVRGPTGAGKELVARAVHAHSHRAAGPFVKVDCAALPGDLVENELFGHERGAFTGADRATEGKVEGAAGGTLFLDEIGELPLGVQGRLLRLLQDRTYFRVGGTVLRVADVRFVTATHRDLEAAVAAGLFRADLYYRLRVVEVVLPPLADREPADRELLAEHFLAVYAARHGRPLARLGPHARAQLHQHPWRGNVRELEHAIEAAVVLGDGAVLDHLPLEAPTDRVALRPLAEVQRAYARAVLTQLGGNRSAAARALGIGRSTLRRLTPD